MHVLSLECQIYRGFSLDEKDLKSSLHTLAGAPALCQVTPYTAMATQTNPAPGIPPLVPPFSLPIKGFEVSGDRIFY